MNSTVKDILKYIQQCGSFHDNCDCLLDNNECDYLFDYIKQLETNINTAIDFIDQVLQYHLSPFDYKQVDEDINTLIGILRSDSNE